jgi:adenosylcobinamide amidohydrolase
MTTRHVGPQLVELDWTPARTVLVWRLATPMLAIASTAFGGGVGCREWIVNARVPIEYDGTNLEDDLRSIAGAIGLEGDGIGFLTAADVSRYRHGADQGVEAWSTVGLQHPTWAADVDGATNGPWNPRTPPPPGDVASVGTINIVAFVPTRLSDAALVDAVVTATEAKAQALALAGVPGTGTASDAICILCPTNGDLEPFAGPRSRLGAPLARAVYGAVRSGIVAWQEQRP